MTWLNRNLYSYTPQSAPTLTFYYEPLSVWKKKALLEQLRATEEILDLAAAAVCSRSSLLLTAEKVDRPEKVFAWPEGFEEQNAIVENLPEDVVLEVGAAYLGVKRKTGETGEIFLNRLKTQLSSIKH